ncbi:ankyrin repeat-containing [Holotrichia oblita]|uniref:Ankyrin repeat-containing n=1 Tax=Holotrichia oblita TaxID=644536 RepID=A0ACB9SIN4_HOLOL|nr:ankyrin repeat-containing [Holotrichia oblita]
MGNKDITKMLIEGMDMKKFGPDWLCDAIEFGDTEVITLLLEAEIHLNITKIKYAKTMFNEEVSYRNVLNALRTCCDYNSDVSRMPLDEYLSIANSLKEISSIYLRGNPDVVSYFPFIKAVDTRRIDIVHLLLKTGFNIDQEIEYYDCVIEKIYLCSTPLCCAVESWNIDMVELLLQHGAKVNYSPHNDQLPLIRAICQNEVIHSYDYNVYQHYLGLEGIFRKRLYYELRIDVSRVISRLDSSLSKPAFLDRRIQMVKVLLQYGADVNFKVKNGLSPLEMALNTRNWMIVEILLLYGANPNNLKEWHFTDILAVLPIENIKIIELLLKNGANPNFKTACGVTPLYVIARRRHADMVRLLFEYGANADIITCTRTLLAKAKQIGHIADVTLLWNLSEMCFVGPIDDPAYPTVVLTLLQTITNQESINLVNEIDITRDGNDVKFINELVRYARNFTNPYEMKYLNVVLELNKPEIDRKLFGYFAYRESLVAVAAKYRNKTMIEILTRNGQGVNSMDESGNIALVSAIKSIMGKSVVEFLLENEADVNLSDKEGDTPLICAVDRENIDIIEVLFKYNATVNCVNKYGGTPLLYAIDKNNANIVHILLDYGADVNFTVESALTPLYAAVIIGNPEIVNILLRYGAQSNIETCGNTLLYKAIKSGHWFIVQLLLRGKYSLILGNYEVTQKIYRNLANANAVYEFGLTPLHLATTAGHYSVVYILLHFNADCDQVDEHGRTALHYAVQGDRTDIVLGLLEHDANVNMKDENGLTPLDYAKRRANSEIIALLSSK